MAKSVLSRQYQWSITHLRSLYTQLRCSVSISRSSASKLKPTWTGQHSYCLTVANISHYIASKDISILQCRIFKSRLIWLLTLSKNKCQASTSIKNANKGKQLVKGNQAAKLLCPCVIHKPANQVGTAGKTQVGASNWRRILSIHIYPHRPYYWSI